MCLQKEALKTIFYLNNCFLCSIAEVEQGQELSITQLHPMQIWLLGCTLPTVYTRPNPTLKNSPSINGIVLMDPRAFITRMV